MTAGRPNLRTVGKYALCQLPGILVAGGVLFLLVLWGGFPSWLAWSLLGLWIFKDAALFPFAWPAYSMEILPSPMVGRSGVVRRRLDPAGYVRIGAELWRAELSPGSAPLDPGSRVQVREQRGLTLLVEEVGKPDADRQ